MARIHTTRIIAAATLLTLTACATCEQHPVACTAIGVIVAGSIIAASQNHGSSRPHCFQTPTPLDCRPVMQTPP